MTWTSMNLTWLILIVSRSICYHCWWLQMNYHQIGISPLFQKIIFQKNWLNSIKKKKYRFQQLEEKILLVNTISQLHIRQLASCSVWSQNIPIPNESCSAYQKAASKSKYSGTLLSMIQLMSNTPTLFSHMQSTNFCLFTLHNTS